MHERSGDDGTPGGARPAGEVLGGEDQPPRSGRGRRLALLVAAGVTAAVLGPGLLRSAEPGRLLGGGDPAASSPTGSPAGTPTRPTPDGPAGQQAGVLGWPLRGDLAGDAAFLAAVRQAASAQLRSARELWAGHVPGGRLVLYVAGTGEPDQPGVGAVYVPDGTAPEAATLGPVSGPSGWAALDPDPELVAWAGPDSGTSRPFVALGPLRRLDALLSDRPLFRLDGLVHRTWRRIVAEDGVAVGTVSTRTAGPALLRSNDASPRRAPLVLGPSAAQVSAALPAEVEGLADGAYRGPEARQLRYDVGRWWAQYGGGAVRFRVLWSGPLRTMGQAAVVQGRLPDGALLNLAVSEGADVSVSGLTPAAWSVPRDHAASYPALVQLAQPESEDGGVARFLVCPSAPGGTVELVRGDRVVRRAAIDRHGVVPLTALTPDPDQVGTEVLEGRVVVLGPGGEKQAGASLLDLVQDYEVAVSR